MAARSMAFLALPSTAVLIVRVAWFDFIKAIKANKDPITVFFDAYSKESSMFVIAARAILVTNSFDLCDWIGPGSAFNLNERYYVGLTAV
jgi:hypothetical protein